MGNRHIPLVLIVKLGIIKGILVIALLSGMGNSQIQILKKLLGIARISRIGADAYRYGTDTVGVTDLPAVLEPFQHGLYHADRLTLGAVLQYNDKFNTHIAVYRTSCFLLQICKNILQKLLTIGEPEQLIHALEVLDVELQHHALSLHHVQRLQMAETDLAVTVSILILDQLYCRLGLAVLVRMRFFLPK